MVIWGFTLPRKHRLQSVLRHDPCQELLLPNQKPHHPSSRRELLSESLLGVLCCFLPYRWVDAASFAEEERRHVFQRGGTQQIHLEWHTIRHQVIRKHSLDLTRLKHHIMIAASKCRRNNTNCQRTRLQQSFPGMKTSCIKSIRK